MARWPARGKGIGGPRPSWSETDEQVPGFYTSDSGSTGQSHGLGADRGNKDTARRVASFDLLAGRAQRTRRNDYCEQCLLRLRSDEFVEAHSGTGSG